MGARRVLRSLGAAWDEKPTAVTLPIIMVSTGCTGLVLGDHASKAFSNFGGATLIRIMGFTMALGGVLVVTSIARSDTVLEAVGLVLAAFGAFIYGAGVILGLGTQGLIAGQLALGAAIGFLGRIRLLMRAGRAVRDPNP